MRLPAALGQRGTIAVMAAISGTTLIGFAGLAVEGGTWYLALRNTATAADLAALAGASALERGQSGVAVATDTARRNGFANSDRNTVTVNIPPTTGAFAGNAAAVEVLVAQTQTMQLAQMFRATAPVARSRAVAVTNVSQNVCLLALDGGLELGGNSTTNAARCALGSNAASPGGISVTGSAGVRTDALVTTGTCNGCASGDVYTDNTRTARPAVLANQASPIRDPFANLRSWNASPPPCRATAISFPGNQATISPGESICTNLAIGTQDTLTLNPGIYYFRNADMTLHGKLNGNGVTLVFTGDADRVGTIKTNAQATGSLRGPAESLIPGHPEGAGLVLYRDAKATNNGSAKEVQLNGGATMVVFGGMYFPTSDVVVNGNSDQGYSSCHAVVGYRLSFSGNSDTQVDVSGCANFTAYPTIRITRLVE